MNRADLSRLTLQAYSLAVTLMALDVAEARTGRRAVGREFLLRDAKALHERTHDALALSWRASLRRR